METLNAQRIYIYAMNIYEIYSKIAAIVASCAKKKQRGLSIDKDRIHGCSVMDSIVRESANMLRNADGERATPAECLFLRNRLTDYIMSCLDYKEGEK